MLIRRLLITAALALAAGSLAAQDIGTRTGGGGTWVEVYFQGTDPSPRCTAILELQTAIDWWRDEQRSVLHGALLLSSDTYTRQQGGLCEFAIRLDTADSPGAFVSTWAPRCPVNGGTDAEKVAYCLAEDLRALLRLYRERTAPSEDPGALANPPE